jgi:glutamate carboxypeptidase
MRPECILLGWCQALKGGQAAAIAVCEGQGRRRQNMTMGDSKMMRLLARAAKAERAPLLALLEALVKIESPSESKPAVDRVAIRLSEEWRQAGAGVNSLAQGRRGNHIMAHMAWGGAQGQHRPLLVLGHMDTVYPLGTLAKMPWRVSAGRAYGPGTFDMKGGLTIALTAARVLVRLGVQPKRHAIFLWTSDEEIGSGSSRRTIESEARHSKAVLVLEPALGLEGRLKTRRKGVGGAEIRVMGRAAHAGINPDDGINALHELAHVIQKIEAMNDRRRGITANATVAAAGTIANVIPEEARLSVDLRVSCAEDATRIERQLKTLRPSIAGARLDVRGGIDRPPLERTAGVRTLFRHAQRLAGAMGVTLQEGSTGGGSDGNLTAALGIPTLDGLGAVGNGAHTPRECVIVRSLEARAALLAGLLLTL